MMSVPAGGGLLGGGSGSAEGGGAMAQGVARQRRWR